MNPRAPASRLRPFTPVVFGRYTLLSPLAVGGMGELFLAKLEGARGFEKLCVIKKIRPELALDPEFVERFVQEAKTLVQLQHGSIAQVLDMGVEAGSPFLALEYVSGKDLRKVLQRLLEAQALLPLPLALYLMGRVLDALAYAHRKRDAEDRELQLVHRDVSPQNILISYEGEVKVVDFGLAKSLLNPEKTNPHLLVGKFLYMSPEQARQQPVDRRSDLYAVGLCLYELISGRHPYGGTQAELLAHMGNPVIPPLQTVAPACPLTVVALVQRALQASPLARFQSAENFRDELSSCLAALDPRAGPETLSAFMRTAFGQDPQQERRLVSQALEASRAGSPAEARSEVTQVGPTPGSAATRATVDPQASITPFESVHWEMQTESGLPTVPPSPPPMAPRVHTPATQIFALPVARTTARPPPSRVAAVKRPAKEKNLPSRNLWVLPLMGLFLLGVGYAGWVVLGPRAPVENGGSDALLAGVRVGPEPSRRLGPVAAPKTEPADLLVPLPDPVPVKPARRVHRKGPAPAPVPAAPQEPLMAEWASTKSAFLRLKRHSSCELESMAILCVRFKDLGEEIEVGSGTQSDEQLLARVRELKESIAARSSSE